MKKGLHIFASTIILVSLLIITGCKKYNCHCIATDAYNQNRGTTDFKVKGTRNKASSECQNYSTPEDQYGNKTTCVIK